MAGVQGGPRPLAPPERHYVSRRQAGSARLHLEEGPVKQLVDEVLTAEGIELRQVRLKFPRDTFFSKGERPAIFFPANVGHDVADDDFYRGKQKMTLRFELPRGAYATI